MDLGVTYVPQIDLSALSDDPSGAALLGSTGVMYENTSVTIMASPPSYAGRDPETYLHVFEIGEEPLAYHVVRCRLAASSRVNLPIDEQNGVVRVVTSNGEENHLFSLSASEQALEVIGDAGVFGEDEDVYAVRFVGDTRLRGRPSGRSIRSSCSIFRIPSTPRGSPSSKCRASASTCTRIGQRSSPHHRAERQPHDDAAPVRRE